MKLRTKFQDENFELGEVVEGIMSQTPRDKIEVTIIKTSGETVNYRYDTIKDFTDHWEDAPEEPIEYWYIESDGSIIQNHKPTYINHLLDGLKSVGNYFKSKEEAEKAVEKLKAWKRLKDKGFRFKESNICGSDFSVCFSLEDHDDYQGSIEDFDKCFLR